MTTVRVEGRVALKVHGLTDAGLASAVIAHAFSQARLKEDEKIEIVAVDLTQVTVAEAEQQPA